MSEQHKQPDGKPAAAAPPSQLSQLMSQGIHGAAGPEAATPQQLERRALAAAEQALAEGQRALDAARAELRPPPATTTATPADQKRRRREAALRVVLVVNLLAMATIAVLPPAARTTAVPITVDHGTRPPAHDPVVAAPDPNDPVVRALAAADRGEWRTAMATLEQHLARTPGLDPGKRVSVLLALEHYAVQVGDFAAAQEYQRQIAALRPGQSGPGDLVQKALAAEGAGDVESMLRHWAALSLQQRQIPSSLYRNVAEAQLLLGDGPGPEAPTPADRAREQQLQQLYERLRAQAAGGQGR